MDDTASSPPPQDQPETAPLVDSPTPPAPLPIEETPEIVPIAEQATTPAAVPPSSTSSQPHLIPPPSKKSGSLLRSFSTIFIFLALFVVGIWLSSFIRQFMPSDSGNNTSALKPTSKSAPTPRVSVTPAKSGDPYASWKTYDVISGVTKKPISGVQFKLPPDVLSPICDGTGCASQGTYLSGGTRLTVAPRGTGQSLRDFRGTVISDVNGTVFTTKILTVSDYQATEFSGSFAGRTVSGYVFSKMRGVMIEISDSLSLEINHFTPNGVTSDFAKDELVFDSILKTVTVSGTSEKGDVLVTLTPTPTRVATSTGALLPTKTPTPTGY